jgi:hypothetical protein
MTVKRGDREGNLFTGSPGGKPPRKNLLGQKNGRKPGQIGSYTCICSEENKRKEEKFRTPW